MQNELHGAIKEKQEDVKGRKKKGGREGEGKRSSTQGGQAERRRERRKYVAQRDRQEG